MEIEVRVRGGILGKPAVQLVDEPDHAMAVPGLPVSHQPVGGKFEVVLQNGTMIGLLQMFPHLGEVRHLPFQRSLRLFRRCRERQGRFGDVAYGGVNENQVGVKFQQFRIVEHGVLPVLGVLRLVKDGGNAFLKQEQFQHGGNVIGGRTAQNGNALFHAQRAVGQKCPADLAAVFQQKAAVKGIF